MRDFTNDVTALALNTATLGHIVDGQGAGWSPEQVIDACAVRGLGGIVFWRRELGDRAAAIGQHVRDCGMQVVGLCRAPFLVGPLAEAKVEAIRADLERCIEVAAEVGAPTVTVVAGGVQPDTSGVQDSLNLLTDRLALAVPLAEQCNVRLALEPLHPVYAGDRSCLVTVRDALDICERIDSPHVGIAVDVYHVWWDTTLREQLQRAGESRIFSYHLCDWLAETRDVLLDRGMMGDGVADLKYIRETVESAGFRGPCEVEIFSVDNWWRKPPDEVLDVCVERFQRVC